MNVLVALIDPAHGFTNDVKFYDKIYDIYTVDIFNLYSINK